MAQAAIAFWTGRTILERIKQFITCAFWAAISEAIQVDVNSE
jgi:magnesium-transporting ATPase (P-type)